MSVNVVNGFNRTEGLVCFNCLVGCGLASGGLGPRRGMWEEAVMRRWRRHLREVPEPAGRGSQWRGEAGVDVRWWWE